MESGEELTEEGADGQGSPARGNGKGPEGLTYLIPALARNPVTAVTIALSTAASLLWWSGKDLSILMEGPGIRRGEIWRFVTSTILHVNAWHLVFNLYWLFALGLTVESILGSRKTLGILALLAVGSGAAEYAFLDGGVGLSGVGYGLVGLIWVRARWDRRFRGTIGPKTLALFAVWFVFCIVVTLSGTMAIGNIAHGVGASLGILLGLASRSPGWACRLSRAALAIATAFFLLGATLMRPSLNLSPDRGLMEAYLCYETLLEGGSNRKALFWGREAILYQPRNEAYWYYLGTALLRESSDREAEEAFRRSVDLGSLHPSPHAGASAINLCYASLNRGSNREAVHWGQKAVQYEANNGRYWCLLAIALFRESMFQEAEAAIHKADELLTPEDGDCRNSILELKHSMTDGKADSTGRSEGSDGRAGPPPPPG